MNKSDALDKLGIALSKAQAEMPAVKFDSKNPFLKNKYASLGAIIETSKTILGKHGLSIVQHIGGDGNYMEVETVLLHESGQWMSHNASLPVMEQKGLTIPQSSGSVLTYLRRYALAAVLGMYSDEDTDGGSAETDSPPVNKKAEAVKIQRPYAPDYLVKAVEVNAGKFEGSLGKDDKAILASALDGVIGDDGRYAVCNYLTGFESTKDIPDGYIKALLSWLGVSKFGDVVNDLAVVEAGNILELLEKEGE